MTALPIVQRELRVASRRAKTFYSRISAAIIAVVVGGWMLWSSQFWSSGGSRTGAGAQLFGVLVQFAFFYCLFGGIASTADCLSQEMREGTLGFLFLTDLRGYDIVFGKLLSTSLTAVYGLMATFPVLAIGLLFGGVQPGQFWRMVLMLLNTLFFSLAIGLFVSSINRDPRRASSGASVLVLFFWFGLMAIGQGLQMSGWAKAGLILQAFSPAFTQTANLNPVRGVAYFWWSFGAVHLTAWIFLGAACWALPRTWQDKPAGPKPLTWRERWNQWNYGSAERRREFRIRLLKINPFFWLASRRLRQPLWIWLFIAIAAGTATWFCWKFYFSLNQLNIILPAAILAHLVLKLWLAQDATRPFLEYRETRSLDVILSTPLSVSEILRGQWLTLARLFQRPVAVLLILDIFLAAYIWNRNLPPQSWGTTATGWSSSPTSQFSSWT